LRSLAVILASLLAEFTSTVTSEVADCAAAVVVSILIILSLVPLFSGMVQTYQYLKRIERQLVIERRMVHQDDNQEVIGDDLGEGHGSAIALVEFV
jgi:DNA-binding transcriptional regulator YbjK